MEMRKHVARIVAGEVKSRSCREWLRMTESCLSHLSLFLNCSCTAGHMLCPLKYPVCVMRRHGICRHWDRLGSQMDKHIMFIKRESKTNRNKNRCDVVKSTLGQASVLFQYFLELTNSVSLLPSSLQKSLMLEDKVLFLKGAHSSFLRLILPSPLPFLPPLSLSAAGQRAVRGS